MEVHVSAMSAHMTHAAARCYKPCIAAATGTAAFRDVARRFASNLRVMSKNIFLGILLTTNRTRGAEMCRKAPQVLRVLDDPRKFQDNIPNGGLFARPVPCAALGQRRGCAVVCVPCPSIQVYQGPTPCWLIDGLIRSCVN
jgi:hypothetical protein